MKNGRILVVDDIQINREILSEILVDQYEVLEADNGISALEIVNKEYQTLSLVLLDIMMPGMDGFEVLQTLKANNKTKMIPVIIITAADSSEAEGKGLRMGAMDFISKPFDPNIVIARVSNNVELKKHRDHLEEMVEENVQKIAAVRDTALETLATVIEYRNLESGQHVMRTRILTDILMKHLRSETNYLDELSDEDIELIIKVSTLHDIGKIGIPDNILLKPGRLTDEEFEEIKKHATIGSDIVDNFAMVDQNVMYVKHAKDICRHHHEKWNGSGYPDGLKGEEIPKSARIVSLVDVYDALTTPRIYKSAMQHSKALEIITENSGIQFDPVVVDAFLQINERFMHVADTI